jgi:hypothetical protein
MRELKFILPFIVIGALFSCSKSEDNMDVNANESPSSEVSEIVDLEFLIEHASYTEYVNALNVKEVWNSTIILEDGSQTEWTNFKMVQSEGTVWLIAASSDHTMEKGISLELDDNNMPVLAAAGGKSCSCEGCSNGCNLRTFGSTCWCTSCNPSGVCTKTETITLPRN